MFLSEPLAFAVLFALVLDGLFGDPSWLYRRLPHPVALMGKAIGWLDRSLHSQTLPAKMLYRRGRLMTIGLIVVGMLTGFALQWLCSQLDYGWILLGILMSSLLAQKSLADHVGAVDRGLDRGLDDGRAAVAHIVGRDPDLLDEHGVARASIESLAENFSDGVVAPAFWGLLFGFPGMLAYKMINTADSMIGYKSERYLHFGRFAAKLDDAVNWLPARLSGLMMAIASLIMPGASLKESLRAMGRDARHHRSPNAGWPEAALAGALGFRLAGPRHDSGQRSEGHWMGDGRAELLSVDISAAIRLFWRSCWLLWLIILAVALICL